MIMEKVLIIGGIGGLTLAIALCQAGIPCSVFERAPELKEVGAGVDICLSNENKKYFVIQKFD